MLRNVLVSISVKKTATRTSELITSLKAILNAMRILNIENQTKYIMTMNLFVLRPWVTYESHLTFVMSFCLLRWKNTYIKYTKTKKTNMKENHQEA